MTDAFPLAVRIDVDGEGHLTVTAGDLEWLPPGPGGIRPQVPLGRSDLPWVLDTLLAEHRRPLDVILRDRGRTFRDLVLPEHLKDGNPSFSQAPPGFAADRHRPPLAAYQDAVGERQEATPHAPGPGRGTEWFEAGGYTPGEPVSVAVIVTRVRADDHGRICLSLPAALQSMIGDAVAIGEESREIYVNQAGTPVPGKGWIAALNPGRPGLSDAGVQGTDDLNRGFGRQITRPEIGM